MRLSAVLRILAVTCLPFANVLLIAQNTTSYLNDVGATSYGVNIPVENGFIDLSNGNLHLEFPIANHPQRGALQLNERLVYDSRIWMIATGADGSMSWAPTNINASGGTTSSGGWRFVTGTEVGSVSYAPDGNPRSVVCDSDRNFLDTTTNYFIYWTDPTGTTHPFNGVQSQEVNQCSQPVTNVSIIGGSATDGSGYSLDDDGTGNPLITDNNGIEVYPLVADHYGNYWSGGISSTPGGIPSPLIDDTGRTPVVISQDPQNADATWYDVLAPNGPYDNGTRVRYVVTTGSSSVSTTFDPSDTSNISQWTSSASQPFTPVKSIQLPSGSQYTFTYDGNGELSSVTLPTGGLIQYGYGNFNYATATPNNWVTSRTVGSNPAMTFRQQVVKACPDAPCVEDVILHKPSGDEMLYELTLVNGAWNTSIRAGLIKSSELCSGVFGVTGAAFCCSGL